MTKMLRLFIPLFVSAGLLAAGETLPSRPRVLVIAPEQTKVEFTLGSLLHTVHGEFKLKHGTLRFDPQSGRISGELVVDATSGDSGSPARDKRMHSSILESALYPEIVFRPDRVDGVVAPEGKSEVQLHGMFSIHGAEHEILMPVTVDASGGRYSVVATIEVPYVKWGMKNPSTLMLRVNDKVEITIETVAHLM
jgi:polyisoprenoid-binding protein YceI